MGRRARRSSSVPGTVGRTNSMNFMRHLRRSGGMDSASGPGHCQGRRAGSTISLVRLVAALALAVVVMLPRLGSPQFGLLDDGLTLHTGHAVNGRWASVLYLIPETGRFFPAYWLAYSI